MTDPKTFPEMLDAAPDAEAFGELIMGMFKTLEDAKDAIGRAQEALVEAVEAGDDDADQ
jgi:hypothetical protein